MTFAVRPIGLGQVRRWEFVGISAVQTTPGAAVNLPTAAQAGDVCIIAGADNATGSAPAGYTIIAAGSSLQYYRICSGGETTASRPTANGGYCALLYRPVGGSAEFLSGATDSPAANRTISLDAGKQCLVVGIANSNGNVTWSAPTMPAELTTHAEFSSTSPLLSVQVAASLPPLGASSTGVMKMNASNIIRHTFGVFTL